jgi:hypothetical protein
MVALVGYCAENQNPILITRNAYDVAYKTLSDALPECSNCRDHSCPDSQHYTPDLNQDG